MGNWQIVAYIDRAGKTWTVNDHGECVDDNGLSYMTTAGLDVARGPLTEVVDNPSALLADYWAARKRAEDADRLVAELASADQRQAQAGWWLLRIHQRVMGMPRRCHSHPDGSGGDCAGCGVASAVHDLLALLDAAMRGQPAADLVPR